MKTEEREEGMEIIEALCADFERREDAVRGGKVSRRTAMEYTYLNGKLFEAAMSVTGDAREARAFLREIGQRRGYAKSDIPVGETTYKRYKRDIRRKMLVALHLAD